METKKLFKKKMIVGDAFETCSDYPHDHPYTVYPLYFEGEDANSLFAEIENKELADEIAKRWNRQ